MAPGPITGTGNYAKIVEASIENIGNCSLPLVCLKTQQDSLEQGAAGDGFGESGPKKKKKKKRRRRRRGRSRTRIIFRRAPNFNVLTKGLAWPFPALGHFQSRSTGRPALPRPNWAAAKPSTPKGRFALHGFEDRLLFRTNKMIIPRRPYPTSVAVLSSWQWRGAP